ncbi:damage-inducible protein DinB [Pseudolabrys taiwanensis]|uniref:Damage-inducible protein DinB n=1 Tax=Pseudolabrys taiwanensis TaxID=331696 RepID=A0A345ZUA3_9HYPH|nr:DinB family protein [Pseudolabrys taiwanensis]AXK80500.1 damage-inducible protein DinB [Pseudolabrys taiwanensis]
MKSRYQMFAGYNAWCNERLYDAAATVPDTEYRADRGAFFKSLHGTLNHLLVADRVWMRRFTGVGAQPPQLDAILYDDFVALRAARRTQDTLIGRYIDGLSEADLTGTLRYKTVVNPQTIEQPLAPALDHFFNHQTHHRGQAHALLSAILGNDKTPSFDLIVYQRQTGVGLKSMS